MTREQEQWVVGIMLSVTLIKFLLAVYCRSFTNEIVKAYAQDHFFDVITNIIGLIAVLLANYISDWMDPVGAIIVSGNSLLLFQLFQQMIVTCNWSVSVPPFYEEVSKVLYDSTNWSSSDKKEILILS